MKHNILSLFMGIGMCAGLLASPSALYAQEDMSAYDIDIDLTIDDVIHDELSVGSTVMSESFDSENLSFSDTTGCVTGGNYVFLSPRSASSSSQLPIAVKGRNIWRGTYDVYVVMVPYYYKTGMPPSELPADSIKKSRIRVEFRDNNGRKSGKQLEYEGTKVDTILAIQDVEILVNYYQAYKTLFPTITVQSRPSASGIKKGEETNELRIDRIILKAKSVTPGKTVYEGSCGENVVYKMDTRTGILTFSGNGELQDYPYIGGYKDSQIWETIVEEGITSIADSIFPEKNINDISLPNSLKRIGKKAFYNATFNSEFALPASLESIGDSAFWNVKLEKIKLPETLESIGNAAFAATSLTEIEIPASVKQLGNDVFGQSTLHKVWWNARAMEIDAETSDPFYGIRNQIDTFYIGNNVEVLPDGLCKNLSIRDIAIPEKVQKIGAYCFAGVPMLSVNISASVKSIGDYAFTTVQDFNVAEGNTVYTDVDGVLFNKDMTELVCYPHLRAAGYRIPDGVKKISNWAFGNKELANVYIPASVNSLSLDAFTAVRTLTVAWKTAAELPELSFSAETYPMLVQVPYGSNEVYEQADGWKNCTIVNEYLVGNALVEKPTFSIFRQMMEATGWNKALMAVEDEEYAQMYNEGKIYNIPHVNFGSYYKIPVPEHRYYGYTVFAERNAVFEALMDKAADAITLQDLTAELAKYYEGKTDEDYASEDHVLNRFVSYHLLPVKLSYNKLVIHYNEKDYDSYNAPDKYTIPVMEYYETMGKGRRLMKMTESNISNGVRINRFMKIDRDTGYEISNSGAEGIVINKEDSENASYLNGYVYALDELLVYDSEVRSRLANERMRYDMASLFPEMQNNELRLPEGASYNEGASIPNNYPYFEDLTISQETAFVYLSGMGAGWDNFQGDEFNITGFYDVTFKLPAVPESGTYELRMAVMNRSNLRGIAQAYVGTDKENLNACGLPIDFRKSGDTTNDPIGWVADGSDEVINQLNDLRMREKGFMKGPEYYAISGRLARDQQTSTRRIIGQFYFEAGKTYYMRLKSCLLNDWNKELYLDYIELVPKSVYDNPNEPEDRW